MALRRLRTTALEAIVFIQLVVEKGGIPKFFFLACSINKINFNQSFGPLIQSVSIEQNAI